MVFYGHSRIFSKVLLSSVGLLECSNVILKCSMSICEYSWQFHTVLCHQRMFHRVPGGSMLFLFFRVPQTRLCISIPFCLSDVLRLSFQSSLQVILFSPVWGLYSQSNLQAVKSVWRLSKSIQSTLISVLSLFCSYLLQFLEFWLQIKCIWKMLHEGSYANYLSIYLYY